VTAIAAPARAFPERAKLVGGVVGIVGTVLLWELLARTVFASSHILPTPFDVARQMSDDRSFYVPHLKTTLREAAIGYFWGNAIAIGLAILFVQVPLVEHGLLRVAIAVYCLPLLAVGPILQIVFSGDSPKAALAALSVFFTTLIATVLGLRSADRASLDIIHVYGGGSWTALRKVRFKASLPSVFAGLRIAAPAAVLGAIVGEYLGGTQGLGVAMIQSQSSFQVARTWGLAFVAAGVAGLGYAATSAIARAVTPWAGKEARIVVTQIGTPRGGGSPLRRALRTLGLLAFSLVALIAIWYGFIRVFGLDPYFAKDPRAVWNYLFTSEEAAANRRELLDALGQTLVDAGIGFAIGTAAAVIVAAAVVTRREIEQTVMPIAIALRSVPLIAMAPLITLTFGRGLIGVTVVVALVVFFPTLVNVIVGLRSAPAQACELVAVYGGSQLDLLRKVRFQYALPALFASARIAAPGALGGAILAEWLASGSGLGNLLLRSSFSSRFDTLWSGVALIVAVSVTVYALVALIEAPVLARYAPDTGV
jgi:ABC-type nitrate/sulfonate/bicarbonate transport system permease component